MKKLIQRKLEQGISVNNFTLPIVIVLLLLSLFSTAQEYPLQDALSSDMLEFRSERRAERISDLLWQLDVDVEVQVGIVDNHKRYYIELQNVAILDMKVEKHFLWITWWGRVFPHCIKHKLIKFEITIDEPTNDFD